MPRAVHPILINISAENGGINKSAAKARVTAKAKSETNARIENPRQFRGQRTELMQTLAEDVGDSTSTLTTLIVRMLK